MKHIIVTGASKGLGLGIASKLLEDGYVVTGVSRSITTELSELQLKYPSAMRVEACDLADLDGLPELVQRVSSRQPIDGLINNAAVANGNLAVLLQKRSIEYMTRLNFLSPVLLSRLVAKHMIRRSWGRIINISSIAATRSHKGLAVYGSTKAALECFTKGLAKELGGRGITVNAVAPGFMDTDMSSDLTEKQLERIRGSSAIREFATPADVSSVVLYLLSENADRITGIVLPVDSGSSL